VGRHPVACIHYTMLKEPNMAGVAVGRSGKDDRKQNTLAKGALGDQEVAYSVCEQIQNLPTTVHKFPLWKQPRERNLEREGDTNRYTVAGIFFK
jgi:hypothetical protein